jgi:hypothetical protein
LSDVRFSALFRTNISESAARGHEKQQKIWWNECFGVPLRPKNNVDRFGLLATTEKNAKTDQASGALLPI